MMNSFRRVLSPKYGLFLDSLFVDVTRRCFCSHLSYSPKKATTISNHKWDRAISDAEKIVGYPTSYFSLKLLLTDEFTSLAQHLRRLLVTNHPILKTAKRLVYHGRTNMQIRGLVVLLLSKAAGHTSQCTDATESSEKGITPRQQSLAEITEMIYTAHLIHKGILNLSASETDADLQYDLQFGNKISILSGDYLLASACKGLANLRNCKVVDVISMSIADFMQSEFLGEHDVNGNALPTKDMDLAFWEHKNFLSTGSLMANSCKATLELAGHNEEMQEKGFEFGKNIGLAWQAYSNLQPFIDSLSHPPGLPLDFNSLPVIFHLQANPVLLEPLRLQLGQTANHFDFKPFQQMIEGSEAVGNTKDLLDQYSTKAENILAELEQSASKRALSSIINSLRL